MFSSIEETIRFVKDENVEMIDFKLVDLLGRWHHVTIPAGQFKKTTFTAGIGIDSSGYTGYKGVHEGDMRITPDNSTCFLDPFTELKTLSIICDVAEPDGRLYNRCPRSLAKRAVEYTHKVQEGEPVFGLEIECYMFDDIRYASEIHQAFYYLDTKEGFWNTGKEECPNLGGKFPRMGGYHGIPPADRTFNLRSQAVKLIEEAGMPVYYHHHETGGPCQLETTIKHCDLVKAADSVLKVKYIIKNLAYRNQLIATFMPKPLYQEGGNAGHVHQCLADENGNSLFYDPKGYAGLNQLALYYIGGLLTHAPALCGLTNPSTNSYKRLVPGYEAPTNLCFSASNRTAGVRIPGWEISKTGTRVEFRPPDATCNPYLSLSAQLMAGLDGIENKIDAVKHGFGPFDIDITKLSDEERSKIGSLPDSLRGALDALEKDHDFLLKGGVFDEDLINFWIKYKQVNDVLPLQLRPHPYEFSLYTDV